MLLASVQYLVYLSPINAFYIRYLSHRSVLVAEKIAWTLSIGCSFTMIFMLGNEYFTQLVNNKLVFSVRALSREEIPIPAILIDSGQVLNPFGFVEKHRNDVTPNDFNPNGKLQSD